MEKSEATSFPLLISENHEIGGQNIVENKNKSSPSLLPELHSQQQIGRAGTNGSLRVLKSPNKLMKRVFKVIMIGDSNVGKTCLSFRFCNGRFPERTEATIGVDFRERGIQMDDDLLRIQLWDTAGQEKFRQSMVSHYYRNVHAVVFVYDLTKRQSFLNLPHWIQECRKHAGGELEIPMILVGNKCDKEGETVVGTGEAQRFADKHDLPLFETSAKADSEADHVEGIFMTLVHKLRESKPVHVQTPQERDSATDVLRLRSPPDDAAQTSSCFGCY